MDLFITLPPETIAKITAAVAPKSDNCLFDKPLDTPPDLASQVAERISYRAIAEHIDSSTLAEEFSASEIAKEMDLDYELLASYCDHGEIAANLDMESLASSIWESNRDDMESLASSIWESNHDDITSALAGLLISRAVNDPKFRKVLADEILERLALLISR
jgi:hypothetical protein